MRDLTAELMKEVCHDVRIDPPVQPLTGDSFRLNRACTNAEARLDVAASGFFFFLREGILSGHFLTFGCFNPTPAQTKAN